MPSFPSSGFLLVDKPSGISSQYVDRSIKKISASERVGHLGTLDPFASGLLVVMLGGATRLADLVLDGYKTYLFTILLGVQTDTLDSLGKTETEAPVPDDFAALGLSVISQFSGQIEQVPPAYSALKHQGDSLHTLARQGKDLSNILSAKKRSVHISSLEMLRAEQRAQLRTLTYRVTCSKGTYVRCLARDIAIAINTVGHCLELRREAIAPWTVDQNSVLNFSALCSLPHDNETKTQTVLKYLQPSTQLLPQVPNIVVSEEHSLALKHGNKFVLKDSSISNTQMNIAFITHHSTVYLSDISPLQETDSWLVQPRKKIS